MAKDVLDEAALRRLAWRTSMPDEAEQDEEPAPALSEEQLARMRAEARVACDALAAAILRVWDLPAAEQAPAFVGVVRDANAIGLRLVALGEASLAAVRFGRLLVRHHDALPEELRAPARASLAWLDVRHPEGAALVVEVIRAKAPDLDGALHLALDGEEREKVAWDLSDLTRRLVEILDFSESFEERVAAAQWVGRLALEGAEDALRRALRTPHLELRFAALEAMLAWEPPLLAPEDVVFVVADSAARPMRHDAELVWYFQKALGEAVQRVAAPDVAEPLESLLDGGAGFGDELDADWAILRLAEAFPERAAKHVDALLANGWARERGQGVEAAALLPHALGTPRLLGAADDYHLETAFAARSALAERGVRPGSEVPAGLAALLDAPPSERFLARLVALASSFGRSGGEVVREKMRGVLFGEAPDREAAALLFALGDDDADAIVARFGGTAVEMLCRLARRKPSGLWPHPLHALASATLRAARAEDEGEDEGDRALRAAVAGATAALRALAVDLIAAHERDAIQAAMEILANVGGAPAELAPALFALCFDDEARYGGGWASELLVPHVAASPALRERLTERLRRAVADASADDVRRLVEIAAGARVEEAMAIARRLHEEDDGALGVAAAVGLADAGLVGEALLLAAIERGRWQVLDAVAPRVELGPVVAEALRAVARAEHRAPAARRVAVRVLLVAGAMTAGDPAVAAALEGGDDEDVGELLFVVLFLRGAKLRPLLPVAERVIRARLDPLSFDLVEHLGRRAREKRRSATRDASRALLERVLADAPEDDELRDAVLEALGRAPPDRAWLDAAR